MSTISVKCVDQVLTITNSPVLASGGVNENFIQFDFCPLWAGYAKICVFYQQPGNYYYSLIDAADKCAIPAECCTSAGKLYFGVIGTKDGVTRTSELLVYRLVQGVMTEIEDPTPDVYQQVLSSLAGIRQFVEVNFAELQKFVEDDLTEIREFVEQGHIADGAITTEKLAAGAVTLAKLGSDVTATALGGAEESHNHAISEITDLQTTLNGKQAKIEYGTALPTTGNYVGRIFLKKV